MAYQVQFVGLVCFVKEDGGRFVLLLDGRNPPAGVDPHTASIIVAPEAVEEAIGWDGDSDAANGRFSLPPCLVSLEGADGDGTVDSTAQEWALPQLKRIDPNFQMDPDIDAKTIARLHVSQGTLKAYAIPGGEAVMTQLNVPFDGGSIHVTVTPDDGSPQRTLRFAPGTEIAIANMATGGYAALDQQNNHFKIYEVLSSQPVTITEPPSVASLDESPSNHVLFARANPIGLSTGCSNTGCCTP